LLSKETESKIHGFAKGKIISQRLNYARDAASHQSGGRRRAVPQHNLSQAGWSWGCVSAIDSNGRTIWIADAHRDNGKRFVVRADEKLTAFVELESAAEPFSASSFL